MHTLKDDILKEIYIEIPGFVDSIDDLLMSILSIRGAYAEQASVFLQNCIELFPKIIRSYAEDCLIRYARDVEYWTDLLSKIIKTFKDTDKYRMVDILCFEIKPSILEYKKLLETLETVS